MTKKTPANKGKVCLKRKRGADGKMRCASFGPPGSKKAPKRRKAKQ